MRMMTPRFLSLPGCYELFTVTCHRPSVDEWMRWGRWDSSSLSYQGSGKPPPKDRGGSGFSWSVQILHKYLMQLHSSKYHYFLDAHVLQVDSPVILFSPFRFISWYWQLEKRDLWPVSDTYSCVSALLQFKPVSTNNPGTRHAELDIKRRWDSRLTYFRHHQFTRLDGYNGR